MSSLTPSTTTTTTRPPEQLETAREFKHYIRGRERVIVKWGMAKCDPCKVIAPKFKKLAASHPGLALAETDLLLPAMSSVANSYQVTTVPVFHFFFQGKHRPELTYQGIDGDKLAKCATTLLNLSASSVVNK